MIAYTLREYINKYYKGSPSKFAEANGKTRQKVNTWINAGYIVVDHKRYSYRGALEKPDNEE